MKSACGLDAGSRALQKAWLRHAGEAGPEPRAFDQSADKANAQGIDFIQYLY
jgi:hypothetical protein